jgi:D-hexose-6-phosphate mutarotase
MSIESDDDSRRWWPGDFRLVHRATFGTALVMELEATNTGTTPLGIEAALHTYYQVADVQAIRILGLRGTRFRDSVDGNRETLQTDDVAITSEIDRVYLETRDAIDIVDPVLGRRIRVAGTQDPTTVVWTPWVAKARALADLGDDEWRRFVCVETCHVSPFALDLAPGQGPTMRAVVTVDFDSSALLDAQHRDRIDAGGASGR